MTWELEDREPPMAYLIHDHDTKFTASFDTVFASEGVEIITIPYRAPNANAFAERWVRSVREECLNHVIILNKERASNNFGIGNGSVIPLGQIVIKDNRHIIHEVVSDYSPGLINYVNDLDDDGQPVLSLGLLHQMLDPHQTTENRSLAGAGDMRKQALVDGIVFGGVRGVVSNADFDADLIGEVLQVSLEELLVGVVATAPITPDQE